MKDLIQPTQDQLQRLKRSTFSLAIVLCLAGLSLPAFAGDVCQTDVPPATPSTAPGDNSFACGQGNRAGRAWVDSNGNGQVDTGEHADMAQAFGYLNTVNDSGGTAFGSQNIANGTESTVFGRSNYTYGDQSSAFGLLNNAIGYASVAFGNSNIANAEYSSGFGQFNEASGESSSAFGSHNSASGDDSNAFGSSNHANAYESLAFGSRNKSDGEYSSGFGIGNEASGAHSSAFGFENKASGDNSSAFGYKSEAFNQGSTAIGYQAVADRDYAVSVGMAGGEHQIIHLADGTEDTDAVNLRQLNAAMGGVGSYDGFSISADGGATSALIGSGATVEFEADDPDGNLTVNRSGNTITYGMSNAPTFSGMLTANGGFSVGAGQVIVMGGNVIQNVGAGVTATDAVNKGQLDTAVAGVSGSAAAAQATADTALAAAGAAQGTAQGAATSAAAAQTSADQANAAAATAQSTADSALNAAGTAQATADTALANAATAQTTADTALGAANNAQDTADTALGAANNAQATADTALGAAGAAVTTANAYTDTRETAIRTDLTAGDAATLASSKAYTDTTATQTLTSARAYTDTKAAAWGMQLNNLRTEMDDRFIHQDRRIDRVGAMSAAYAGMATNTSGLGGRNRVGVGVGGQNGAGAIAIGYQRVISDRASVSIGGAFGGGESSITAGAGFSW